MLELNRVYWQYDNGDWWRPTPYHESFINIPKYKTCKATIREDLFDLVERFAKLYENYKFYIALSGGIDSEITAETFYQLGVPFEAVTLSLFNGANAFDIEYAKQYCKERAITQHIVELPINIYVEYVIPKAVKFGQFTDALSQVALTYLFESMKETDILIFSGHNPDIYNSKAGWWEDSPNLVKFAKNTQKNFFTFTSLEPIFIHYSKNYDPSQPGDKNNDFIYNCYPNLKQRIKKTGWENLTTGNIGKCWYLLDRPILPDGRKSRQVFLTWK
jgi:hypothetical protein